LALRLVPLNRFSAAATANTIADRLFNPELDVLSPDLRQDGALRAILDLRDNLRRSSAPEFSNLVSTPPSLIGDTRWDAFVAAIVEDESARKGTVPPRWTNDPRRFIKPFWYLSDIPALHSWELHTAPAAFVRHGVLAAEEELASV
jgi:hypothetical protein